MAVLNISTEGAAVVNFSFRANNYINPSFEFLQEDETTPHVFEGDLELIIYNGTKQIIKLTPGVGLNVAGHKVDFGLQVGVVEYSYELREVVSGKPAAIVKGKLTGSLDNNAKEISSSATLTITRKEITNKVIVKPAAGSVDYNAFLQSLPGYDPEVTKVLSYSSEGFVWVVAATVEPEPDTITNSLPMSLPFIYN